MNNNYNQISKFLSYALRHEPEKAGVTMDKNGWVEIHDMIKACVNQGYDVDYDIIENIVNTNDKKRFTISVDGERIRANQGHSVNVDVELKVAIPPNTLYHGTTEKNFESIMSNGILPQSRLYVHLSSMKETAEKVGGRRGKPVVLKINSEAMHKDNILFYLSENNVWLTKEVLNKYITIENAPNK